MSAEELKRIVAEGGIVTYGPSMCESCDSCESVFVDCPHCGLAFMTVVEAHTPERKEVKGEER